MRLSVMFLDGESEDEAQVLESGVGVGVERVGAGTGGCEYKQKQK